ncbi:RCC1 domain-containing protein [Bifidobacterium asteroides]|uniref:Chromosome condensation regulator RCC1 n=1 Tax=Bifidobacterium asteroides TaxID=1684 RepID=A0A318MNW7_9BIFI|nr:InlB B-repeat-containing protein [Bifidobacterium asteroides]PXY88344.1 chromosome condensation regulator RCC1 [Bifidobacterium asteroides]
MSALVLIPLLLTGMVTGTVFTSGSDINEGGGRYTAQIDNNSLSDLQPTNLPSPSPLATSSIAPSPAQTPTDIFDSRTDTETKPDATGSHTAVFDPADGGRPERVTVPDGSMTSPPLDNPKRDGYRFVGWFEHDAMMDFRSPITRDITLKAKWTPVTDWTLSPDHGPASGGTSITITPPSADSPLFSTLEAYGEKLIGATGDGRLFTWTSNDKMPVQVPSPQGKHGEVRFTSGVVGEKGYAALSRDHRIYTWSKSGDTPALLDADSTAYTSIVMADNRLLAVDRQGQIHAFQDSQRDSQDASPKSEEQETASLPGKAQAVSAVASGGRILIVDTDGQAWAWDTANAGSDKPARVKQNPGIRIVQAQALNQGFLLLDTDGQDWYLTEGENSPTAAGLLGDTQISRIASGNEQATIIDKDGHVWAWMPGEAPTRIDDGSHPYMQTVKAGSRVTAVSTKGSMFTWSLDGQGQPGNPTRLDAATAPILESASMDGQPLTLTKNNDSLLADMPASKPRQATITIIGRQDGQPFTRSLNYTFDQTSTRDTQQGSTYTVHFNTGEGGPTPQDQSIKPVYGRVQRPSPDPAREGYQFDGWFIGPVAYDFSKPLTKDLTLTAHWTLACRNNTWTINPDKGTQAGTEFTTITPPDTSRGIRFSQVSGSAQYYYNYYGFSLAVGSDGNAYAWGNNEFGQLGDGTTTSRSTPVMVKKPTGTPSDFTYVQVSAGSYYSLALGSDGNAYAWGYNPSGQLGDGTTNPSSTPVRVSKPADTPADLAYVHVDAGGWYHSLALGSDGNAYAWGRNQNGELGDGTENDHHTPIKVSKPAGTPADFTYVQVGAGSIHSLALGSDGNAYAWGHNNDGQLGDGTTTNRSTPVKVNKPTDTPTDFTYVQVYSGYNHALAVGSDGYAYAWGDNWFGQLGNDSIPAGELNAKAKSLVPVRVRNPANSNETSKGLKVTQVSGGWKHSLALGSDGNVYAWGRNDFGQLGNNSQNTSYVPVRVRDPANPTDTSKGLNAVQFSAGTYHSLAVGSDGYAYAWGSNHYGQLGDNTTSDKRIPVPVWFNLTPVITGIRFDQTPASGLTRGDGSSVSVLTPAHMPGMVTVSVDYTLGGAAQKPDTSLRYTYTPLGMLPRAGGEGILLALATGMTGMGGVLASRRHRREAHSLSHASYE